ncbi:hypothetical protein ANCCAN_25755 [Ancylostoma caninum]|uniref:Uncharacterized protein n=1 Tax=Ancylostoma caninum TaxID=29170 RepID=A0A368F8W0_ANCCA|nr:hypothetical protein ANCCAN_25755 [Ancylostoma caninum]
MASNEGEDKKTGTRVFKKTSPNGKVSNTDVSVPMFFFQILLMS